MGFLGPSRRHTKKSCIGNAVAAVVLAVFMVACIFMNGGEQYKDSLLFTAGLMVLVALYWCYRWYKFDDKDFNDPFHLEH